VLSHPNLNVIIGITFPVVCFYFPPDGTLDYGRINRTAELCACGRCALCALKSD